MDGPWHRCHAQFDIVAIRKRHFRTRVREKTINKKTIEDPEMITIQTLVLGRFLLQPCTQLREEQTRLAAWEMHKKYSQNLREEHRRQGYFLGQESAMKKSLKE